MLLDALVIIVVPGTHSQEIKSEKKQKKNEKSKENTWIVLRMFTMSRKIQALIKMYFKNTQVTNIT